MSAADEYILQESIDLPEEYSFDVIERRHLQVNDSNLSNYSGNEIIYDLSTVSNSGSYIDWRQTYLQIPLVLQVERANENGGASRADHFCASLKNGNFSLIHSISLTLSNQNIIPIQPNLHGRISYELASNFTEEEAKKAIRFGYQFEDGECSVYGAGEDANGIGFSCTSVRYNDDADNEVIQNKGRLERMKAIIDPVNDAKVAIVNDDATLKLKDVSYRTVGTTSQTVFLINCKIPMDIVHDYFAKCPLTKNSLYSLSVFLNAPVNLNVVATGAVGLVDTPDTKKYKTLTYSTPNGFNPIQLSSAYFGEPMAMAAGNTSVSAYLSIVNKHPSAPAFNVANKGTTLGTTTSLFVSTVKLSPTMEKQYLFQPEKTFRYEDVIVQKINNVTTGTEVQQIITNNMSRLRKMVILPYHAGDTATAVPNALLNPFDGFAAGYLSSPMMGVDNFNVHVSGVPVYHSNLNKSADFFREFQNMTLNGGAASATNGSLVDFKQYLSQYGAIVVDLTRHTESVDDLAKNVTVQFRNNTKLTCSYIVYLYYEKQISINAELGNLVI